MKDSTNPGKKIWIFDVTVMREDHDVGLIAKIQSFLVPTDIVRRVVKSQCLMRVYSTFIKR